MGVGNRAFAKLSRNIFRNTFYGARAVERDHGVDVVYGGWFQLGQIFGHAGAIELKQSLRFSAREHGKNLRIVKWNFFDIDLDIFVHFDQSDCIFQNCQVADAQEIEFGKTHAVFSHRVHVVLRYQRVFFFGVKLDRHIFGEWFRGNDHTRRVHRNMADGSLEFFGDVQYFARFLILVIQISQLRLKFHGVVDRHGEPLRTHGDEPRDPIAGFVRFAGRARDVAHRAPRHHGAKGADLRHLVGTIFFFGVLDDFLPAVVGKVHVDIRRRWTERIQKPLERKFELERINVGDTRKKRHQRPGDRSSDGGVNVRFPRKTNQVSNDQKIRRIFFFLNDAQFVLPPFLNLRIVPKVVHVHTRHGKFVEHLIRRFAGFQNKIGENKRTQRKPHIALIRDFLRVFHRFRNIFKDFARFFGRNKMILPVAGKNRHVLDAGVGGNGDKRFVGEFVLGMQIMGILRRHQRNAEFLGKRHKCPLPLFKKFEIRMIHDFEIIIFGAEDRLVFPDDLFRLFHVARADGPS